MMQSIESNNKKLTFADLRQIIVFGFDPKTKKFVYIDNCENGLSCGLICRFCGNPLSAKNNCITKRNHFAHKAGSDCRKGHESTIPLLFKKVLDEDGEINLSDFRYPFDYSIVHKYGKVQIESAELEKYENDLSFNVIVQTSNGMKIAFIPFMKSADISLRKDDASRRYEYVMTIDFKEFKNSHYTIEDIIREIISERHYQSACSWVKNREEATLKLNYDLKCKEREEESQRQLAELTEQRRRPVIIDGATYYHIEGVETFASQKRRVFIKNKNYDLKYMVDFSGQYKAENGLLRGYRLDDDGVVSSELEVIRFQQKCLWLVR